MKVTQLDHVALTVSDPLKSADWYHSVLGLERKFQEVWGDYPVVMTAGSTGVMFFPALITVPADPPDKNETIVMRHLAFRTDGPGLACAQEHLQKRGVPFTCEDHRIARSIYFADPDGHQLEITTYDLPAPGRGTA